MTKAVSEEGSPLFHSLEKWNPRVRVGDRLTWVYVWGVPLQAWSSKHLRKITAAVGEFVDMDDEAEDRRRLDRARVLIKTSWMPQIQHTIDVAIGEETFKVTVTEECGGGDRSKYGSNTSVGGSSEEIDSDESYLDGTNLVAARLNNLETTLENLPEFVPLEDHGVLALPSGQYTSEDPLGNEEDRTCCSAFDHQIHGKRMDIPEKAPTVTDKGHRAENSRHYQGKGSPIISVEPQNVNKNGNGDRGEGREVSSLGDGVHELRIDDIWSPHGCNSTNCQAVDFLVNGSCLGQNCGAFKGPTNGLGLSEGNNQFIQHTSKEFDGNTGLFSQNNKAITESGWVVYSRKRRGKKKFMVGQPVPLPTSEITQPNLLDQDTQQGVLQKKLQCSQQGVQTYEADFVDSSHDSDVNQNNEEGGTNPEPHNQQYQQALDIWCKARQLGVSGMEDQQVIIDQLMKMEERDGLEAQKRGVSTML